jgi:site-specific recombinase XerD
MEKKIFNSLIEGYFAYLRDVKLLAHGTLKDIKCTFNKILDAIDDIRPGKNIWELSLDDFMIFVEKGRKDGRTPLTINKEISHIRGLLEYAWRNNRTDRNVLEGFFLKDADNKKAPEVLTIEETNQLLKACSQKTKEERYNRLIIMLLYGCGLRTGELCSLDVQDIDTEDQAIFVKKGKGQIQRKIPVPEGLWTELLAYLTDRGGKRGPLFRTRIKNRRISQSIIGYIVKEKTREAGLKKKITATVLRHTFATHLMDSGVDISIISSLMGHRTPRETGVYLHAFKDRKESAVNKLNNHREGE